MVVGLEPHLFISDPPRRGNFGAEPAMAGFDVFSFQEKHYMSQLPVRGRLIVKEKKRGPMQRGKLTRLSVGDPEPGCGGLGGGHVGRMKVKCTGPTISELELEVRYVRSISPSTGFSTAEALFTGLI